MVVKDRHSARDIWLKHSQAHHLLHVVVPELERVGVAPLLVKGVALGSTLYADPSERPISDVDLRVAPEDMAQVRFVVRDLNWPIHNEYARYGSICIDLGGLQVDIESHIGPPGLCRLPVRDLRRRAQRQTIGRTAVLVPELTDHALVVVVNLFKDKVVDSMPWARADLARVLDHPSFDEAAFISRARHYNMTLMARVVLEHLPEQSARMRRLAASMPVPAWYPLYARVYAAALKEPKSAAARVVARLGSDAPEDWPRALVLAALVASDT